jgi:hypothetical protein
MRERGASTKTSTNPSQHGSREPSGCAPLRDAWGYRDARVFAIYQNTPCLVYAPISENIHGFERSGLGTSLAGSDQTPRTIPPSTRSFTPVI